MSVLEELESHLKLKDFGLDWRDGERTIHEVWRFHPSRRLNSYALSSLYLFASDFVGPQAKILDFGCGTGFGTYLLAAKSNAAEVWGIDKDEGAVGWGQKRYVRSNLRLTCVDLHDASLDKFRGSFDMVYCSNVMEHVPEYQAALERIHSLIKPLGVYFQATPPSGQSRGNPYHVTNFTVPEWKHILDSIGFYNQRYFAQKILQDRDKVQSEYDFAFVECGPDDMWPSSGLGSEAGLILGRKSHNKAARRQD